jgi:arsenate reductase (thioredoxin)
VNADTSPLDLTAERPSPRTADPQAAASRPVVLFLCVHNAGRSQMAAGWLRHIAGESVDVYSGGSRPGSSTNPNAVAAMAEVGIDIASEFPKAWTDAEARAADVIVTMGCGDACPVYPGKRYEDWQLADPAGQPIEVVRAIRDEIETRVRELIAGLDLPDRT